MKKKSIIKLGFIILLLFFIGKSSYWYIRNNNNNINIRIANYSQFEDSVNIKMYWDEKMLYNGVLKKKDWYKFFSFNCSLGKHTLKIVSPKSTEIKQLYVLPIKFIAIEYYGQSQTLTDDFFTVTTSSSLIKIE